MSKVSLTLKSDETSATDLEEVLDALRPILALTTNAQATVEILEED
ncbi:hypothetical protein ES703_80368 [subsurface metagenome]